jgi:predicted RNA-binding Zn ribbon-like protein
MSVRTDSFEWSGGHPALDLVNTLDERPSASPVDRLAAYEDLVRFSEQAGLIEDRLGRILLRLDGPGGRAALRRARALREHLHAILAQAHLRRSPPAPDLEAISGAVQAAHAARILVPRPSPAMLDYTWARPATPEIPLHACALAIERLLVHEDRGNIRKCGADDCGVFFLDSSKSGRRQWCSMKACGNREKQRRWRSSTG